MNIKRLVVLSLLANAALGLVVAMLLVNRPASSSGPEPAAAPGQAGTTNLSQPAKEVGLPNPQAPAPPATRKFDWRLVESQDYKKYIANLRAIGCPEETIRDIITADVNKLFESRRKELSGSTNKFQYWKANNNFFARAMDPDRMEKTQALNKEKRDLLTELLGVAPEEKPNLFANFNPFETMLDFLPEARQSQIMDVMMKYQGKMMKYAGNGQPDEEDMKKIRQLQKDMETEIAGSLSPDEYRQYQLRMSQTANTMRYQLASFEASQEEFDKVYELRKKYDDEFTPMGMGTPTPEDKDKAKAAKEALNEQIKAALGDDRYAEYERAQDGAYQSIYRVTDKYGLPKETAGKVFDMKKTAEDAAQKVRSDTSLSAELRDAALLAIRTETEGAVQKILGDKAWTSYSKQTPWFKRLTKTTVPTSSATP